MIKSILHFFTITLLSSLVSGCIGYVHVSPTECSADLPIIDYIYEKDKWGPTNKSTMTISELASKDEFIKEWRRIINKNTMTINTLASKNEFIKEWGEPDETIQITDDETILVYNRKIWCGSVPIYMMIPAPLVLPTCDGFDRITFKGDTATHIHFKRSDASGFVFPGPAGGPRACPHTKPSDLPVPTYSKEDNISDDNTGLVVLYRPESFVGSAGMHFVTLENNLSVPLYNGSYYKYLSTVGEKEFTYNSDWGFDRHLKINIKPKQKYYLRFEISLLTGISLEEVPAEIAEEEILELTPSIPQNQE